MSKGLSGSSQETENVVKDHRYMAEKNNSRSGTEKSEPLLESDNHDVGEESMKECLTCQSQDSERETSTPEDCDCERFTEKESTGCGDRRTESTHSESSRCKSNIRHRGHQDGQTEMAILESNKQNLVPKELSIINHGYTDMRTESTSDGVIPNRQNITSEGVIPNRQNITSDGVIPNQQNSTTDDSTTSFTSLWGWFIYFASRIISIIFLSFIYLGFAILSIKVLHLLTKKT